MAKYFLFFPFFILYLYGVIFIASGLYQYLVLLVWCSFELPYYPKWYETWSCYEDDSERFIFSLTHDSQGLYPHDWSGCYLWPWMLSFRLAQSSIELNWTSYLPMVLLHYPV